MTFLWFLWELLINTVEILVFVVYLTQQLKYSPQEKYKIWGGCLFLIVLLTTLNFLHIGLVNLIVIIAIATISYTFIAFHKHNSSALCILRGSSVNIIAFLANGIVNNIAAQATDFPVNNILAQSIFRFEMMNIYIFTYIILFLILYFVTKKNKEYSLSLKFRWFLCVFVLLGTIAAGIMGNITLTLASQQLEIADATIRLIGLVTGILFVIIITSMLLFEYLGSIYERKSNLEMLVYQKKAEEAHYNNIKENYQKMSEWKHDYKNNLLVISEYLNKNQYDKLENYIGKLSKSWQDIDLNLNSGNVVVDAIIYDKQLITKEHNIPFNCQINMKKSFIFDDVVLCSILGNILDNAIEASLKVENNFKEKRFIDFKLNNEKGMIFITVKNYYTSKILYKNNNVITDKNNPLEHGIGLKRVKKLVKEKEGFFNIDIAENIFTIEILLPTQDLKGA